MDLIVDFPQTGEASSSTYQAEESPSPRPSPSDHHDDETTSSRARARARRGVTFATEVDMTFIENLTFEHKSTLWFSSLQLKSFNIQLTRLLRAIHTSDLSVAQYAELNASDTANFMGMENYLSKTSSNEIRYQRRAMRAAILLEQERQRGEGVYDPDAMASVSEAASDWSRKRSQLIALIHCGAEC